MWIGQMTGNKLYFMLIVYNRSSLFLNDYSNEADTTSDLKPKMFSTV